jgi:hypothetical protein
MDRLTRVRFATEESLKEIYRVLRPGAVFGMIWNIEDCVTPENVGRCPLVNIMTDNAPKAWVCSTKWEQLLKDIILGLSDGHPRFRHLKWREVFERQPDTTPLQTPQETSSHHLRRFSLPLGKESVRWTVWLTEEAVWNRYSTLSQIANLKGEEAVKIRNDVFAVFGGADVERNERGEVALHGVTYFAWTLRV